MVTKLEAKRRKLKRQFKKDSQRKKEVTQVFNNTAVLAEASLLPDVPVAKAAPDVEKPPEDPKPRAPIPDPAAKKRIRSLYPHPKKTPTPVAAEAAPAIASKKTLWAAGPDASRAALYVALKDRAVLRDGPYRLKNGGISDVYFDARLALLDGSGAWAIGAVAGSLAAAFRVDAVAGPTMGADPIVVSTLVWAHSLGVPLAGGLIRSEAKDHGTGKLIEGPLQKGNSVLLVEDTSTTGGTLLKAAEVLAKAGMRVPACLVVVDRGVDPQPFAELGIQFFYLFDMDTLLRE